MQTSGLKLDEFCSHVIKKSKHLQSMGVSVSEKEARSDYSFEWFVQSI